MDNYKLLLAGDTALVVEFGDCIDRRFNERVVALATSLRAARLEGVVDLIPTFRSLLVQYEPLILPTERLVALIERAVKRMTETAAAVRHWKLPVCYDPEVAIDITEVAALTGLSVPDIVERHSAVRYHVYMLGFLPGQAYLGDVPPELRLARRLAPRVRIPAGSLGIAMAMTSIFPRETPCGWHIIGRSPVPLWNMPEATVPLLAPGDQVRFAPVSLREYHELAAQFADERCASAVISAMEAAA